MSICLALSPKDSYKGVTCSVQASALGRKILVRQDSRITSRIGEPITSDRLFVANTTAAFFLRNTLSHSAELFAKQVMTQHQPHFVERYECGLTTQALLDATKEIEQDGHDVLFAHRH